MKRTIFQLLYRSPISKPLAAILSLRSHSSYLAEMGWFRSFSHSAAVDAAGNAIPWYTYPAIEFLDSRDTAHLSVFEYGSGNSTRWWAQRAAEVVSCEHDADWYARVQSDLPANVDYRYCELQTDGDYARMVLNCDRPFDIVVVDGRDRVNCAKQGASGGLSEAGVLIWDNTQRARYAPGFEYLRDRGFKRLDFVGLAPIVSYKTITSVFYRPGNCLDL